MSDMWIEPGQDPRTYGNPQGEKATYQEYLRNYRLTLEMKCQGLTPTQLAMRSVPPSSMSLLGLIRHMASVEHNWFRRVALSTGEERLFKTVDDRDHDFNGARGDEETVTDAFETWHTQIHQADAWLDALDESELGRELPFPNDAGTVSVRDLLVHMIEEYARHCGHADLLRECVDGRTGQ
jgi:uncharacterized damage-inducible protein DinB